MTAPPSTRSPARAGAAPRALLAAAAVTGALACVPLLYLAVRTLEAGPGTVAGILARPRTGELLTRSVLLAGSVTAACLVLGCGLAWLVARTDLPGRRVWAAVLALPLAVPSYVAGFTWIAEWPGLAGFPGAFLVLTLVSYPYVLLPVAAALLVSDGGLEEVARSLGRGPGQVLLSVTLRRVRPTAAAAGLLVALYVLSDFGAVSLMRYETFTLGIYTSYRATFDRTPAAVLGCVLVVLAALLTWGEYRARGRAAGWVGRGTPRPPVPVRLGAWRPVALLAVVAVAAAALGVPAVSLVRWTVAGTSAGVDWPALGSAAVATLQVAGVGAALTTLLALPVGILAARHRGRVVTAVETAAYAGHALPGVTIGLALVFVGIRLVPGIYQELPLLVVGYAVLFLPLTVGAVRTAVAAAPVGHEEVARSLGCGRAVAFARVTLPRALPGTVAGAALVFLTVVKELPVTLMLRPTGTDTLAVQLWSHTGAGAFAAAAPYAVVLVLVSAVPAALLDRAVHR
ncbi:iron ABC transporter permease [Pseudonocardia halophobica]|uniref:ABC transporter permease n=1 Tax=Pseudonocardia halophobica TaxID=29401 RepID=A0A9W6NYR5_9PSEU|nr:iron ABC transporter permease [Pseudonocardia halophobica]GLL14815.1 ABC transporter permease [Pseudonocardia halophobica]